MRKVNYENLDKYKRKRIIKIFISLIILSLSIGCYFWYKAEVNEINSNIKNLRSVITNQEANKKYIKTYVNAQSIPELVLDNEKEDEAYYIVKDDFRNYVVYMNGEDFYKLDRYDITSLAIRIEGVTVPIKENIKKEVIDTYNRSLLDSDKVTLANFDEYFGEVYLNMTIGDEILAPVPFYLFILLLSIGLIEIFTNLIYLIIFIVSVKKLKNNLPIDLEKEMDDAKLYSYKNVSLYLTEHYIINFNGRFKVIRYEDILWMYKFEQKVEQVIKSQSLKLFVNDGRTYKLAKAGRISEEQKASYDEIWQTIIMKNSKVLVGYTEDNIKKVEEIKKELKRGKRS